MIKLADVVEANRVLVALGGEDQMQRIAAASIERSLELQNKIDRALAYAAQTPPNSAHARQIARILDGSITIDDELNEVEEHDVPMQRLQLHPAPAPAPRVMPPARGPGKKTGRPKTPGRGLAGRSTKQRKAFREWADQQGYNLQLQGPVPQEIVEAYDRWLEEERLSRIAERKGQLPM